MQEIIKMTLKAARVNKGLTQSDIAHDLGVNKKTVWSWENHKTMPNAKLIQPLCDLLGVTYDNIKWQG